MFKILNLTLFSSLSSTSFSFIYMCCTLVGGASLLELEVFDTSDPVLFLLKQLQISSRVLPWTHCYLVCHSLFCIPSYSLNSHPLPFLLPSYCELFSGDQMEQVGIGRLLDVPSASKNSKGLAPGFKIQAVPFGGIWGRSKRYIKTMRTQILVNYQWYRWERFIQSRCSQIVVTKYGWYCWIWLGSWWTPWNRESLKSG